MNRNITLNLDGTTRYLPFDLATAHILAIVQVAEADEGTTDEFVVVWRTRESTYAVRIADQGDYGQRWEQHPESPLIALIMMEDYEPLTVAKAIMNLSDDEYIASSEADERSKDAMQRRLSD